MPSDKQFVYKLAKASKRVPDTQRHFGTSILFAPFLFSGAPATYMHTHLRVISLIRTVQSLTVCEF